VVVLIVRFPSRLDVVTLVDCCVRIKSSEFCAGVTEAVKYVGGCACLEVVVTEIDSGFACCGGGCCNERCDVFARIGDEGADTTAFSLVGDDFAGVTVAVGKSER
jgi:hypothetical protein